MSSSNCWGNISDAISIRRREHRGVCSRSRGELKEASQSDANQLLSRQFMQFNDKKDLTRFFIPEYKNTLWQLRLGRTFLAVRWEWGRRSRQGRKWISVPISSRAPDSDPRRISNTMFYKLMILEVGRGYPQPRRERDMPHLSAERDLIQKLYYWRLFSLSLNIYIAYSIL